MLVVGSVFVWSSTPVNRTCGKCRRGIDRQNVKLDEENMRKANFGIGLILVAAISASTASAAIINGSFESETLGSTTAPTGGWGGFQSSVSGLIVSGTGVTNGTKALQLSASLTANQFRGQAIEYYFSPTIAPMRMTIGEQYTFAGSVTTTSAGGQSAIKFIEWNASNNGFGNEISYGGTYQGIAAGTRNFSANFTYRGGAVVAQLQLGSESSANSVSAVFDNFSIVPVPEPTSLAVISVAAGLILTRRRSMNA